MTLKEAHILTLRVLKQVMDEKLDQHNVQLAQVRNCSQVLQYRDLTLALAYRRSHQSRDSKFWTKLD